MERDGQMEAQTAKTFTVKNSETADSIGSGGLQVLSTPHLVAYMENVALESAETDLDKDHTTVGVQMNIKHLAPTGVGEEVIITSKNEKSNEKAYSFEIEAYVGDNKIGEAEHNRVVVEKESFMKNI